MSTQVKVGGVWIATIGGVGSLRWSSVADGGSEDASWSMPLSDTFTHPALRGGNLVQVFVGSYCVWVGVLAEPEHNDDGWKFTAIGLAEELSGYLAFDSGLNTTSVPDTAVDEAIARGLPCTRPTSLSAVAFAATDQTDELNSVADLLSAWATSQSMRWEVNSLAQIVAAVDPTTPTWYLTPGSARIGLADDDYASDLYLRYLSKSTRRYNTVHVSDPLATVAHRRELAVDKTGLGLSSSAAITDIGNGLLAKGKARYAWTDAATPSQFQLTTTGGQPACLALVKAGDMCRLQGALNEQGVPLPYVDFIIGRVEYEDGARTITIAPTELAPRDYGDVAALAVS